MRVKDVMTKEVARISPSATADEAWRLMRERRIHHLVVTDGRRVVGVVSERDAGGRMGSTVRQNRRVGDLMTAPAVTVESDATIRKAANLMRGRSIGSLVVLDNDRSVGIITVSDLLELVGRGIDRGAATTTRWTLRHRAPHRKTTRAPRAW
jgi:CBS domain-containing protein